MSATQHENTSGGLKLYFEFLPIKNNKNCDGISSSIIFVSYSQSSKIIFYPILWTITY